MVVKEELSLKNYQRISLTALSAVFLFLSFKELGFFAWFALMPYLFAITGASLKKTILYSFILGAGFFAGMTYWLAELYIKYTWPMIVAGLSLYIILFGIAACFILNRIDNPYMRLLLIPASWLFIEFARSQTFLAFTIGIIGYSQHSFLPLMHLSRFTGIYGISFLILLFNMSLYETIRTYNRRGAKKLQYMAAAISILILVSAYGINSVNQTLDRNIALQDRRSIEVAAVQPKVLFGTKFRNKGYEIIPEPYSESSHFRPGTELVIFPESVLWGTSEENPEFFNWAGETAAGSGLWMLVGQYDHDSTGQIWTNSLILYDSSMKERGRYDEIHPVPFSQYMPYPHILGFLKFLDFSVVDIQPGSSSQPVLFKQRDLLGFSICYESTLPYISGKFRRNGAEVIIVSSDDSSLNDSIAPWHHLIFSKTRAIENGCYAVHCANTGFSAIISPAGNYVRKMDLMEKGVLYGTVYMMPEKTFYAKYGNILLYLYLALSVLTAIVYLLWKQIRKRRSG